MNRIVDPAFEADVEARTKAVGLDDLWFGDGAIAAELDRYGEDPEKYRAAFDILTWAARTVMDRRAKNPPQRELAIGAAWPALARGWNLRLDVRRGLMEGTIRGRQTSARVVVEQGAVTTHVDVAVPLPAGATLSLTRQKDGFFSKLFRGQDIVVGDPVFDQTFVIKGEPEAFVRAALTPAAREQILHLTQAGASITLKDARGVGESARHEPRAPRLAHEDGVLGRGDLVSRSGHPRIALSLSLSVALAGAFAMAAAWPTTRPSHAFLQLFLGSADPALSGLLLLCILHPADELVSGERRDVVPSVERGRIGDQRLAQIVGELVHDTTGDSLAAHAITLVSST